MSQSPVVTFILEVSIGFSCPLFLCPHDPGISQVVPSAQLLWSLCHPSSKILHYLMNCEGNKILSQRAKNLKKSSLIQPSQKFFLLPLGLDQERADPSGSSHHPTALRALSSFTQRWLFQQDQEHFSWGNVPISLGYPSQPHLAAERMQRELPLEKPQGKQQNLWEIIKCWDVSQLPASFTNLRLSIPKTPSTSPVFAQISPEEQCASLGAGFPDIPDVVSWDRQQRDQRKRQTVLFSQFQPGSLSSSGLLTDPFENQIFPLF